MGYEQWVKTFSKDVITIDELAQLLIVDYNKASQIMREIKHKHDRLHIRGRLHLQDYCDYYGLDIARYCCIAQSVKNQ